MLSTACSLYARTLLLMHRTLTTHSAYMHIVIVFIFCNLLPVTPINAQCYLLLCYTLSINLPHTTASLFHACTPYL